MEANRKLATAAEPPMTTVTTGITPSSMSGTTTATAGTPTTNPTTDKVEPSPTERKANQMHTSVTTKKLPPTILKRQTKKAPEKEGE